MNESRLEELSRLYPEDIGADDLVWLNSFCKGVPLGFKPEHIVEDMLTRSLRVYRLPDPANGLIMYQVLQHPGGRELFVWGLAGEKVARVLGGIRELTHYLAAELGCRWVGGVARKPAHERFYEEVLGVPPAGKIFLEELKEGVR